MRTEFANQPDDPEAIVGEEEGKPELKPQPVAFVRPAPVARQTQVPTVPGWPFDANEAKRRQKATGLPAELKLPLSQTLALDMVLVPAGEFVLGSPSGDLDEAPATRVKIARPFYMSRCEITNAQYALCDAAHDSAYISMTNKDHSDRGHAVNGPSQPVVRINWRQAMDYCRWLSAVAGRKVDLPSEAQWEWACRSGTASPLSFGGLDDDFSKFANLADASLGNLARGDSPRYQPRIERFNDGAMVTADVGRYQPNAWGLCDMHGNAAEWTRTAYRPYPYNPSDGRDDPSAPGAKAVRGGSWFDRPYRATSSFRLHYEPWQHVYNVGFRIILEVDSPPGVARQ
jgi:formylglycine-generating enzyme required for sulfatase activity